MINTLRGGLPIREGRLEAAAGAAGSEQLLGPSPNGMQCIEMGLYVASRVHLAVYKLLLVVSLQCGIVVESIVPGVFCQVDLSCDLLKGVQGHTTLPLQFHFPFNNCTFTGLLQSRSE